MRTSGGAVGASKLTAGAVIARGTGESASGGALAYDTVESPLGPILLAGTRSGLRIINFQGGEDPIAPRPEWRKAPELFLEAASQIRAYFARKLLSFDLQLEPRGTSFQLAVWEALRSIPYGKTISYGELARRIGNPAAVRAVGAANGKNPLPLVLPCHRVIGADGSLTGYHGGLAIKRHLLALEAGEWFVESAKPLV